MLMEDDFAYNDIDYIDIPKVNKPSIYDISVKVNVGDMEYNFTISIDESIDMPERINDVNMIIHDYLKEEEHLIKVHLTQTDESYVLIMGITRYAEHVDDYTLDVSECKNRGIE